MNYLPFYLSHCLSIGISISVCTSVCTSVCLSVRMSPPTPLLHMTYVNNGVKMAVTEPNITSLDRCLDV